MNDIQQLIDRYLAEGLSSDELARLSRAVHRADAPAEWLIIREMIDTLTEGEDDYDLILAAREAAAPVEAYSSGAHATVEEIPAVPFLRSSAFKELAAASIFLVAAIGAVLYFTYGREPQIAEVTVVHQAVSDSPTVGPAPCGVDSSWDSITASASSAEVNPVPVSQRTQAQHSIPRRVAEHNPYVAEHNPCVAEQSQRAHSNSQRAVAAVPKKAAAQKSLKATVSSKIASCSQDETMPAKAPIEVPERRIYSCNLLDQIPESYEAPTNATDGY